MTKSPWSVKGIDPEAREAAKIAARRAGLTVGAWLTRTIRQTAADQLGSGPRPAHLNQAHTNTAHMNSESPGVAMPDVPSTAPDGNAGPRPSDKSTPSGRSPPPAPTMEALLETVQRLASRLDAAEKRAAESVAPVERAVQRIVERLDRIENGGRPPSGGGPAGQRRGVFGLFRSS